MSHVPPVPVPDDCPVIVVPCYNEERRLDECGFLDLINSGGLRLIFVNDGSDDGTDAVLERLKRKSARVDLLELSRNSGKAEAVRRGLLHAVNSGASIVGYFDADMATPGAELVRMLRVLQTTPELTAVFGSRIARLGSHIRRSPIRHYSGRIFATVASMALGVAVYDTQCGAKVFRVTDTLAAAIQMPFGSPWSFDVLLCQRLLDGVDGMPGLPVSTFVELPLECWTDREGSKVDVAGSVAALIDVISVGVMRRSRARGRPGGSRRTVSRRTEERAGGLDGD